ncbi:MAG: helix-turn-helix transcriptional regulator [Firmicutes bacterium]|nr:helix-turn-helix transcriptional regulator [Bacillota bacterium]
MPSPYLGERIRRTRLELGLSGSKLARMIGKSQPYISDLERNQRIPSLRTLEALSAALGKPVTYFLSDGADHHSSPEALEHDRVAELRHKLAERIAERLMESGISGTLSTADLPELTRIVEQAIANVYHEVMAGSPESDARPKAGSL